MNKVKSISLAFLIYAPTLVLVPQTFVYIIIALIGLFYWFLSIQKKGLRNDDAIFIVSLLISLLIYLIGKQYAINSVSKSVNDILPYTIFILATLKFSEVLSPSILRYILIFILVEILIGLIQYIMGVSYFIKPSTSASQVFRETELLYYKTVYGLSSNTSTFSLKIFTGVLLIYFLNFNKQVQTILYSILVIGLLLTFNRTAIVSSAFFAGLFFLKDIRKKNWKFKIFILLGVFILFGVFFYFQELIETQFFRGRGTDLSGRDLIFPYYYNFIKENPVWGNFFTKHWVTLSSESIYHAHNSFLQTFANMGLIFGSLLFIYIFRSINKQNYIFILPILLYSSFQYGILWGVSFLDILFFYFLFNIKHFKIKNNKTSC